MRHTPHSHYETWHNIVCLCLIACILLAGTTCLPVMQCDIVQHATVQGAHDVPTHTVRVCSCCRQRPRIQCRQKPRIASSQRMCMVTRLQHLMLVPESASNSSPIQNCASRERSHLPCRFRCPGKLWHRRLRKAARPSSRGCLATQMLSTPAGFDAGTRVLRLKYGRNCANSRSLRDCHLRPVTSIELHSTGTSKLYSPTGLCATHTLHKHHSLLIRSQSLLASAFSWAIQASHTVREVRSVLRYSASYPLMVYGSVSWKQLWL